MTNIYIAETDNGDWVALYVDGKCVYQAHDIHWSTMLNVIYNRFIIPEHTKRVVYDSEVMSDRDVDTFPETLQELYKMALVSTHVESPIKGL